MAIVVLAVSPFIASAVPAQAAQTAQTVAQKALQSVVMLTMEAKGKTTSFGSGFVVRAGAVATNLHVVEGSVRGSARLVGMSDEYRVAGILALDREQDLVLLSVPGINAPSLSLGDSSRVAVGDGVYVVGNPRGLEGTFSQGIISAIRQVGTRTLIQLTAPLSPGSSGGPVLNTQGEVIGIAEATVKGGQNLNFAVPASYLSSLLAGIETVGPPYADTRRMERPKTPQTSRESEVPPSEQSKAESHIQRCDELIGAERYNEAEQECRSAEAEGRDLTTWKWALVHSLLAEALTGQGKWDGAIAEYREALRLSPNNPQAHMDLGTLLSDKADFDGAVAEYGEAVAECREEVHQNPNNVWAHLCVGIALGERAKLVWQTKAGSTLSISEFIEQAWVGPIKDENYQASVNAAIAELREAIRLDPGGDAAHYNLGLVLEEMNDTDGAIAQFGEAVRLNPNNGQAHHRLGDALGAKGDLDGAIGEERLAVQSDPNNPWSHHGLASWLERKGDYQDALAEYRSAFMLAPLIYKGEYEAFLQRLDDARKLEKLQHWLGKWTFAGPVKSSSGCGGRIFPMLDHDIRDFSFDVLTITPSGHVRARIEHPLKLVEGPGPDWSGTATEKTLVLTMDSIAPGTELLGSDRLRDAWGRLEASQEGDRYSAEFIYFESRIPPPKKGCSDYSQESKRFLGEMKRP
jgi:tetratricopeptide (TPR) repeat protein